MQGCMGIFGTILQHVPLTAGGGVVVRQLGRQYGGGMVHRCSGIGAAVGDRQGQKHPHL